MNKRAGFCPENRQFVHLSVRIVIIFQVAVTFSTFFSYFVTGERMFNSGHLFCIWQIIESELSVTEKRCVLWESFHHSHLELSETGTTEQKNMRNRSKKVCWCLSLPYFRDDPLNLGHFKMILNTNWYFSCFLPISICDAANTFALITFIPTFQFPYSDRYHF